MAQSIKLSDNNYIDSSGVWESNYNTPLSDRGWKKYYVSSGTTNFVDVDLSNFDGGIWVFSGYSNYSLVYVIKNGANYSIKLDLSLLQSSISGSILHLYVGSWNSYAYYRPAKY